ncbi:SDR family NAD(P)-dependent oxidoreductase [Allosediminivita pacifica]|uniref:Meso-butanediol dehydrogenase/(S,S)-butanediol dehydrogenase/diacetyl reductase n=1 Tax=Allosediminivita pacifica TaxID=1267769 RepID=A0A2T6B127_9RHOB|nr:SDR family NAD(P)-dependent oxidoreductase [Allosediminivita pacifica]PTX49777.1 meso-butanediol dehydrogenase/(S,S)-butanediol dehydrogenase/diacetyl reductase [Allosediminivita pacifica]GGB04534.1 3-oxoacyl-ACP reductase [Allosediminivita pacifica]
MRFDSKTVIVTGAASGIGAATARRFAEEGANLVIVDMDETDLDRVADDLPPGRVRSICGDTSGKAVMEEAVQKATDVFGGVDVVVPNAGYATTGTISDVTSDQFRDQIHNNVDSTFNAMKAAWPALKLSRGCVVATSSVSGERGDFGGYAYNASKGAVSNMVRAAALDFGDHGIRVNAVAPGFTHTGMTAPMEDDAEFLDSMKSRIPMGRGGNPEEIAAVIVFLASGDASFINGAVLPVDGGVSASNGQPPLA